MGDCLYNGRYTYMEDWLKQIKNGWDETSDSSWYQSLRTDEKINELLLSPNLAFHPTVYQLINKYIPNLNGKKVLLPSSGDNHAAFAFAVLGAKVTSTDISERQLENAQAIAKKHNLDITFACEDTMQLTNIENNHFDLVYTSNGTHVWINELNLMYKNIYRVIKPYGVSIMYDIHPFNRPFTGDIGQPVIKKSYNDVCPHYHWRIHDLINTMISSGLTIREMDEMQAVNGSFWYTYDELITRSDDELSKANDWQSNPMAALPAWISIVAQK